MDEKPATSVNETQPVEKMSFEQALTELETIVRQLERDDVTLDESIKIYERGARLRDYCQARLQAAEIKIEQIVHGKGDKPTPEPASFE